MEENMRVNISYSLELDDIPREVAKFVREIADSQEEVSRLCLQVSSELDDEKITTAVDNIDKIRKVLMNMDTKLQDSTNILAGYQRTLLSPPEEQEPPEQQPQEPQEREVKIEEG
jgi:Mg2+ and Co2+ transporter CorA